MLHRSADWLAGQERLPESVRAVLGYYSDTGVFDPRSLLLKRRVDTVVGGMLDRLFTELDRTLADELGHDGISMSYDTKLVLPAKLTLGQLYRQLEPADHRRAEELTRLAVEALIDGDMRDAINDEEFGDFKIDVDIDDHERRQIAEVTQEQIQRRVEKQLAAYSEPVRDSYEWAVRVSNAHQERDQQFRELMAAVQRGGATRERLAAEYRDLGFEDTPELLTETERSLPYIRTQYDRVGVLYDAMLEMYRGAGLTVERPFRRSIVLAIIGAQIWLDDVDDFEADLRSGQLTPATAEYLFAAADDDPRAAVLDIGRRYFDRAQAAATAADSALTGIAIEYIRLSGDPGSLPPAIEIRDSSTNETDTATGTAGRQPAEDSR